MPLLLPLLLALTLPASAPRPASPPVTFTCTVSSLTAQIDGIIMIGELRMTAGERTRTVSRWRLTGPPAERVSTTMGGTPEGVTCSGQATASRTDDGRVRLQVTEGIIVIGAGTVGLTGGTFTERRSR
jgi:hypothetical protein